MIPLEPLGENGWSRVGVAWDVCEDFFLLAQNISLTLLQARSHLFLKCKQGYDRGGSSTYEKLKSKTGAHNYA